MHLDKKKIAFSAIIAAILPQLCVAANTPSGDKGASYNVTLMSLVGLVIILLFIIGMLAHTLSQLTIVVRDKNRKEKQAAPGLAKGGLLLLILLSSMHTFAEAPEVKAPEVQFISGIPIFDFYLIMGVIGLELMVIYALVYFINVMLKIIQKKPELQVAAKKVAKKNWFWDKLNNATAIEKEKDILLDHDYDGIQELDNSLPPWWKYGFYVTIIVSFIYIYRFHVSHDGMSQEEEFIAEMVQGEEDKAAYLAKSANNVDESNVILLTDPAAMARGKDVFIKNCAACHLADGGGTVGPNLTDEYWMHGGSIKDIFKSIKYGWQDKGMKSWQDDLSPIQIQEVSSFIKGLAGTHPATPKAPQGELYIEAQTKDSQDTAKATETANK